MDITNNALDLAIQYCGPGKPFKGIGKVIHDHIRRSGSYCVSQRFTGHGIGNIFHRPPWILHHLNDEPGVMLPGHCFTIEVCVLVPNASPNALKLLTGVLANHHRRPGPNRLDFP